MSLVGQYDMDLFTTIFSLLFVPVPGFTLGAFDCLQVTSPSPLAVLAYKATTPWRSCQQN